MGHKFILWLFHKTTIIYNQSNHLASYISFYLCKFFETFLVSFGPFAIDFLCKSPVAVHNNRHMIWDFTSFENIATKVSNTACILSILKPRHWATTEKILAKWRRSREWACAWSMIRWFKCITLLDSVIWLAKTDSYGDLILTMFYT